MTKPIRSFPEHQRVAVATRRASNPTVGLGKISAENFLARLKKPDKKP